MRVPWMSHRSLAFVALLLAAALAAACGSPSDAAPAGTEAAPAAETSATEATEAIGQAPAPAAPPAVANAAVLPASTPASRAPRSGGRIVVALDPGHGGDESGAAAHGVVERDSNLDMAHRVARYLEAHGIVPFVLREDAGRAAGTGLSGNSATRADLQARVRAANAAGAAAFVSLHSNGSPDASMRGVEAYYESRRPFAAENARLGRLVLDGALQGLASAGYPSHDRGLIDAACWRNNNGRCIGLFVLSPAGGTAGSPGATGTPTVTKEATEMPAVLLEVLFISNAEDAALLRNNAVRDAAARGIADAIARFVAV